MAAKNGKAPVPWKKLNKDPGPFIDDEYLPDGFTFDDPMHIPKPDLLEVFSHWEDRLAAGDTVFSFKGVSHDHRGTERPDVYRRLSSLEADQALSTNRLSPAMDERAEDERSSNEDEEAEKDQEDSEDEQEASGGSGNIGRVRNRDVRSGNKSSGRSIVGGRVNGNVASSRSETSNQQASSSRFAQHERAVAGSSRIHRNGHAKGQRIGNADGMRIGHGSSQQNGIAGHKTDTIRKGTSQTIGMASTKTFPGRNTSHREVVINRRKDSSASSHTQRDDNGVDEDEYELHLVTVLIHFPQSRCGLMHCITA
jgi:hypothetical protein